MCPIKAASFKPVTSRKVLQQGHSWGQKPPSWIWQGWRQTNEPRYDIASVGLEWCSHSKHIAKHTRVIAVHHKRPCVGLKMKACHAYAAICSLGSNNLYRSSHFPVGQTDPPLPMWNDFVCSLRHSRYVMQFSSRKFPNLIGKATFWSQGKGLPVRFVFWGGSLSISFSAWPSTHSWFWAHTTTESAFFSPQPSKEPAPSLSGVKACLFFRFFWAGVLTGSFSVIFHPKFQIYTSVYEALQGHLPHSIISETFSHNDLSSGL